MNHLKNNTLYTICFLIIISSHFIFAQQTVTNDTSWLCFEPLIGTWQAPDSILEKIPQMKGRAVFKFEFDKAHSHIKILEDYSLTDKDDYEFSGMLILNPVTSKFEFFGVNAKRNFLFKGYFSNVTEGGFTREYDVYYPPDSYMAQNFGQIISFREEFVFEEKDKISFQIKYYNRKSKQWEMWSDDKFIVIKGDDI